VREVAYFVGSLAGAAIMTALAILLRPESPIWKVILWGGIGVFAACACVVALGYVRPGGNPYFLAGAALGVALFTGFGAAFLFGPTFAARTTDTNGPDISMRFIYPDSPALVLVNNSDKVARQIKWTVVLWNLDDPRVYSGGTKHLPDSHEPLRIPVETFDFLRPHVASGPRNLFGRPNVEPFVKEGNRLFGSASVICPDCIRGHTYIVYIEFGRSGWFAEVSDKKSGNLIVPSKLRKDVVLGFFEDMTSKIPESQRIPISDR